jgi:NDMA-dependent alcohol dehydrogenase
VRTRGAVIREVPGKFEVVDLELAEPLQGEVLVRMSASGMCHSDLHYATGDMAVGMLPMLLGHEGAGVVEAVGPNTDSIAVGDHVVFPFLASCGRCTFCARGQQNLCRLGANMRSGSALEDPGRYRFSLPGGERVGQHLGLGTFAEHTVVSTASTIVVDKELPLETICLLGCGVGTGWGSAVNSAEVEIGDTVIVMGVGGIGINAVQGASHAGASNVIAVDPVAFKREKAQELGATHAASDMDEATELARSLTNGEGADSAIVTVGVVHGEHVAQAFAAIRKAGTVVVTGVTPAGEMGIPVWLGELTLYQKRIQGSLFGGTSPNFAIPKQIELYRSGQLKLDQLITRRYTLDQVQQGYDDLEAGLNIRGVITYS